MYSGDRSDVFEGVTEYGIFNSIVSAPSGRSSDGWRGTVQKVARKDRVKKRKQQRKARKSR